ncbi:MAG: hypothetical protein MK132_07495 [Lentisphaerales bacterium]|nr:hypothetical protein [Lentisphaerales bacterium]
MLKFIFNSILCLTLFSPVFLHETDARGRRSSSFSRSFFSSRSKSFSSSRSGSIFGNYSRSKKSSSFSSNSTKSSYGSGSSSRSSSGQGSFSNKTTSKTPTTGSQRKTSSADKALAQKSNQTRKTYSSRSEAVRSFEKANKEKYTSTYKTKPGTRPSHIPQQTTYNNRPYNVDYNPTFGGYGHFGPSGAWIAYSVFRDAAMMSMLMRSQNYHYTSPMTSSGHHNSHYVQQRRGSSIGSIIGFMFFMGIITVSIFVIRQNIKSMRQEGIKH